MDHRDLARVDLRDIKAVFFDRGNVVYDCTCGPTESEKDRDAADRVGIYLRGKGMDIETETILERLIKPWKKSFSERDSRGYELPLDRFVETLFESHKFHPSQEAIDELVISMSRAYLKWHELESGFAPLLRYLRGKGRKTGVVSNAVFPDQIYISQLEDDGLKDLLDICVFSYGAGVLKPERRILEIACSSLGLETAQCVLVGDKLDKDVACARNAGATSIWYNSGGSERVTGVVPDYEVRSLAELQDRALM